jgi:hypothetical protein
MFLGSVYFLLSTFTLVQWVCEHTLTGKSGAFHALTQGVRTSAEATLWSTAHATATGMNVPAPPPPSAPPPLPRHQASSAPRSAQKLLRRHVPLADAQPASLLHRPGDLPSNGGSDNAAADVDTDDGAPLNVDDRSVREQLGEQLGDGLDALGEGAPPPNAVEANSGRLAGWIDSDSYGKFIGITTFFNPGRHQNKVDNFRKFRAGVAAQGLQLLCVELVFGGETSFQLRGADAGSNDDGNAAEGGDDEDADASTSERQPADCEILIHRRTMSQNTLWQKERLLNVALENLPRTVDKVMWLDSDLIFLNDDWVPETAELLDRFPVVQPFGWMTYLPSSQGADATIEQLPTLPLGQGVGAIYHSAGLGLQSFADMCFRSNFLLGHPGFAWAARRDVITAAGFYDRSIIGGGDRIMLNAFTGHYFGVSRKMPPAMAEDVRAFGRKLTPLVGPMNVSYTPGVVLHIWHGNRADRDYTHRYQILQTNKYDPVRDVSVNEDGVLVWSTSKPRMHKQVTEYFSNRKEGAKSDKPEGDDVWTTQRKSLSRPVRSFLGYHCGRPDYRASCKLAFRLWGDTLRAVQLQVLNKRLREQQAAAQAAIDASREAAERRSRSKLKAMRERKTMRQSLALAEDGHTPTKSNRVR